MKLGVELRRSRRRIFPLSDPAADTVQLQRELLVARNAARISDVPVNWNDNFVKKR